MTKSTLSPKEEIKVAVLEVQMQAMTKSVDGLGSKIDELTKKIDDAYVKKEDFNPVKAQVDSLRLWQAKVFGIAAAVAVLVDVIIRIVFKN